MPTYEYRCEKCGNEFEAFQRMSDASVKKCPKCQGRVRRLISGGSGLIFKGSGFYITDYARKNAKPHDPVVKSEPAKAEPVKTETTKEKPKT